jgi:hypothetical protein
MFAQSRTGGSKAWHYVCFRDRACQSFGAAIFFFLPLYRHSGASPRTRRVASGSWSALRQPSIGLQSLAFRLQFVRGRCATRVKNLHIGLSSLELWLLVDTCVAGFNELDEVYRKSVLLAR